MKFYRIISFLLLSLSLYAQQKGAAPLTPHSSSITPGATYAVVIGISDYQSPDIPDLRFADRDAEAFANFLRSSRGLGSSSLDAGHLKVLINTDATLAQVAMAFSWLMEVAQEGDEVIIYFSGHGDVESVSFLQPGFLLCWDAPPKVYMAGGAFSLQMLQTVISSLSLGNKADVVMIADACHSGKLSGSSIGGSRITGSNLAEKYANEIKILSCQPDEYSIEGEQWGGGRGAFSYHLVNGLYGMADKNTDLLVTLSEMDRYLEDHVTPEVAPISQVPVVYGNKTKGLAHVDVALLDNIRRGSANQPRVFSSVDSKGIEEEILAAVDTSIRQQYLAFKQYLKDRVFFQPTTGQPEDASATADNCADACYRKLIEEPSLERLHPAMRRNYAAALMESSQQFMNGFLSSDAAYCQQSVERREILLKTNIAYLERAIELLGSDHYMHATLQSYRFLSKGMLLVNGMDQRSTKMERGMESIENFRKALSYQPGMPLAWLEMSRTFGLVLQEYDSAQYYVQLAMDAVPGWVYAYTIMSRIEYSRSDYEKAIHWLDKAALIDSSSITLLLEYGTFYMNTNGDPKLIIHYLEKAVDEGTIPDCHSSWLAAYYMNKGEWLKAEETLKKLLFPIAPGPFKDDISLFSLSEIYSATNRYEMVREVCEELISRDSTAGFPYAQLGIYYMNTGQPEKGMQLYEKAKVLEPGNPQLFSSFFLTFIKNEWWDLALINFQDKYAIDTNIIINAVYVEWINCYLRKYREGIERLKRIEEMVPAVQFLHLTLGYYYSINQDYEKAETYLNKGIAGGGHRKSRMMAMLGFVYLKTGRAEEGKALIKEAYRMDYQSNRFTREAYLFICIGGLFRSAERYQDAADIFEIMLEENPDDPLIHMELARTMASSGKTDLAYYHLEMAIKNGYNDPVHLRNNVSLKNLWGTDEWKVFMQKHFPGQVKD